ncbi:hypothetical protein ZIOFF_048273 [Zingiber officinale]|uniref:Polyprotein n=1 Tax=Zingiber officinale TaxID=94328 RepID=A0A8J5KXI3_ZINOF|nr:hypothetical protein ZIOFF_048273 [Zingiber officinale]
MNSHDWALIHKIKKVITDLPDLAIPPEQCYIILETDGCMEGWGVICKWNPQKYDAKSEEKICAYASGKYSPIKSTIDAEIHTVMNSMDRRTSILHPEEHDKRSHMTDIEWATSRNVINNLRELELICQVKENDFKRRSHYEGQSTYWKDALPAVTKARLDV